MTDPGTATLRAWSCTMRLAVDDARALRPATADLVALLARVDAQASRFRPDSDLVRANALAGRPVPIPRLLTDLVGAALDAAAQTDGAVDPTVGAAMRAIGYDRDIRWVGGATLPATDDRASRAPRDWRDVRLDRDAGLLFVPRGVELDLGATAKAFVADRAAQTLARRYETAVLVELGGDLAVAGDRAQGWCVTVAERAGADGQRVLVRFGGLATSTTTVRRWRQGERERHHILDPRTGVPAVGPWRTVSVHAPCALAANTATTTAIVLGERALPWLRRRNLSARLVSASGEVVTTGDWPTSEAVAA
jgi:thiamine biosynthesis lipoprotein